MRRCSPGRLDLDPLLPPHRSDARCARRRRMNLTRRLGTTLLLGVATGALFLGAGGRLVMRLFALATGRIPSFSARGTLTVVLAGAVAGAVGGLILFALARLLPRRPWLRGLTLGAVCYVVAIPGFRPPQPLVFALFAAAFLAYGLTLAVLWSRLVDGPATGQHLPSPSA